MRQLLFLLALSALGCNQVAGLSELTFGDGSTAGGASGGGGEAGSASGGGGSGGASDCDPGFADCDGSADNGCERDITADPAHCGVCNFDCQGASCMDGICGAAVLATGQTDANDLEVHNGFVYWIKHSTGEIQQCAVGGCGGVPTTLGVSGNNSYYLAVTDAYVFWNRNSADEIWRAAVDGSSAGLLISGVSNPTQVGADASSVYWHSYDGVLRRGPHDGSQYTDVIAGVGNSGDIQPHLGSLFWSSRNLASPMWGQIGACVLDDCSATARSLVNDQTDVSSFDFDDTHVYFGTIGGTDDIIGRTAVDAAPNAYEVLASGQASVSGISLSDTHIYWVNNVSGGAVRKMLKDGGSVTSIASGLGSPRDVGHEGSYVFVSVSVTGEIWRYPE